ncbi:hypothetical protein BM221_005300 [Beauveria bassiana]|uniref:Uncharacterized protein n=1 Tax=Beauveria bassiana TaxID=176275 RepID=A0A2N6NN71_BEABA|nr:hypothetical protein BM221_005300 [Beauveria bassiana]
MLFASCGSVSITGRRQQLPPHGGSIADEAWRERDGEMGGMLRVCEDGSDGREVQLMGVY